MKRSYYTKAEMIAFARYIVSDERRFQKQRECHEKIKKGMVNPTPWSISERQVTDEDFINWKNKKQTP